MPSPFDGLREALLAAGVAPRHVRRYLVELDDHLADLRDEEACPREAAEAWTLARLGTAETLAGAMIARKELRGWDARLPWAAYLLVPTLALAVGFGLALGLVYGIVESFRPAGGPLVLSLRAAEWTRSITAIAVALLPILLGWGVALAANGRRRPPFWPALGVIVLGILGGASAFPLVLPTAPGEIGELDIEFALLPPYPGIGLALLHIAANLALMLLPFAAWRHRRAALAGFCLVAAFGLAGPAEASTRHALAIIAAAKAASGGTVWDRITGWHERGTHGAVAYDTLLDYQQYGSRFQSTRDGKTVIRGYNGSVGWDQAPDGQVTISTDPKRLVDDRQSAYASAAAYFFPDRFPARFDDLGRQGRYDRIRIAPKGAKPFELWIDHRTHLIAKLVDRNGPNPVVATVSDYHDVNGLKLPSGFTVSDGSAAHAEAAKVQSYELVPVSRADFDPPAPVKP